MDFTKKLTALENEFYDAFLDFAISSLYEMEDTLFDDTVLFQDKIVKYNKDNKDYFADPYIIIEMIEDVAVVTHQKYEYFFSSSKKLVLIL